MALGTTFVAGNEGDYRAGRVAPCSVVCDWQTAITAGGIATRDAATITNPTTEVINSANRLVDLRLSPGTYIAFRLKYVGSVTTSPIIQIFGRKGTTGTWQRLYNQATPQTASLTITAAPTTDIADGTYSYSEVTKDHIVDRMGNDQFLVGTTTAVAGGTTASDVLQFCSF